MRDDIDKIVESLKKTKECKQFIKQLYTDRTVKIEVLIPSTFSWHGYSNTVDVTDANEILRTIDESKNYKRAKAKADAEIKALCKESMAWVSSKVRETPEYSKASKSLIKEIAAQVWERLFI